jgi:hypothetical protein
MENDGVGTLRIRAADLRMRADRLRRQISETDDDELIRQLTNLAAECDLLADAVDALHPDDQET